MEEWEWLETTDSVAMMRYIGDYCWGENYSYEDSLPRPPFSHRKLRLFACACCRQVWDFIRKTASRMAVAAAEKYADGLITFNAFSSYGTEAWKLTDSIRWMDCRPEYMAWWSAINPISLLVGGFCNNHQPQLNTRETEANLLREIFGNPFRQLKLNEIRVGDRLALDELGHVRLAKPDEEAVGVVISQQGNRVLAQPLVGRHEVPLEFLSGVISSPKPRWKTWNNGFIPKMVLSIYKERNFEALPILADVLEEAELTDPDILSHLRGPGPHVKGCWVLDYLLEKK